jgi:hypothetical protein
MQGILNSAMFILAASLAQLGRLEAKEETRRLMASDSSAD